VTEVPVRFKIDDLLSGVVAAVRAGPPPPLAGPQPIADRLLRNGILDVLHSGIA
jgi:hypothetical protein